MRIQESLIISLRAGWGAFLFLLLTFSFCTAFPGSGHAMVVEARADHDYPPYEFLENGRPAGFNIDILKAVAKTMGLDINLSLGPWNEVRQQLEMGEIDMLAGMFYSKARAEEVDFSSRHIVVHHSIFVRMGSNIQKLEDLRGKSVLVQSNDIMHDFAKRKLPQSSIIEVEKQAEALRILGNGKYDAALVATLQGYYNIERYGIKGLHTVGKPMLPRDYCFAVRKGADDLLVKLNEGLAIIRQTGEYRQIYDEWFSREEEAASGKYKDILVVIALIGLTIAVVFLLLTRRRRRYGGR